MLHLLLTAFWLIEPYARQLLLSAWCVFLAILMVLPSIVFPKPGGVCLAGGEADFLSRFALSEVVGCHPVPVLLPVAVAATTAAFVSRLF